VFGPVEAPEALANFGALWHGTVEVRSDHPIAAEAAGIVDNDGRGLVLLRPDGRWVRRFHPLRGLDACPAARAALPARLEVTDTAGIEAVQPAETAATTVQVVENANTV
jgi:hypothetical protein